VAAAHYAGVIDKDVEMSETVHYLSNGFLHLAFVPHIEGEDRTPISKFFLDLPVLNRSPTSHRDDRAGISKPKGHRSTQSTVATGDQCDAAVEREEICSQPPCPSITQNP